MTIGGAVLTIVMLVGLYIAFMRLPDGASHGPLAEAVGPWMLLSLFGVLVFSAGLLCWIIGIIAGIAKK